MLNIINRLLRTIIFFIRYTMYIKKKNKNKLLIFRGEIVNNNFEFYYLQIIKNPPRKLDKTFCFKTKKNKNM